MGDAVLFCLLAGVGEYDVFLLEEAHCWYTSILFAAARIAFRFASMLSKIADLRIGIFADFRVSFMVCRH